MSVTEPPEDNDLGQNAQPIDQLTLDTWSPRSQETPPQKYEVCNVCGFIYPRKEMVRFRQKWYCKPQTCYEDIQGILLKENPERYIKNRSLADSMRTE